MDRLKRYTVAVISAAMMLMLAGVASATDYVVNTNADDPTTPTAGQCTLRDAISASQHHPSPGTTCDAVGGADNTIRFLPALSGQTIVIKNELPRLVLGALTIEGPTPNAIKLDVSGLSPTIMGALEVTSLSIPGFTSLTLSDIGFSGGPKSALFAISVLPVQVNIGNCSFTNFGDSAILSANGVVTIKQSTFTGNSSATSAPAILSTVHIFGPPATSQTTIDQSNFINNNGLAVFESNALTITGSLFNNNRHGVLDQTSGVAQVSNSTFSDNGGYSNGGVITNSDQGTTHIVGSTFTGNTAPAISNLGGKELLAVTVLNSTFVGNADAISSQQGLTNVYFSTFSNNLPQTFDTEITAPTTVVLQGNIVSNAIGGKSCNPAGRSGRFSDFGGNIFSDNSCPLNPQLTSVNNTDPGLDPLGLENHGGPTLTIAFTASSRAAEFVPSYECNLPDELGLPIRVTTDQRGYGRPAPTHPRFCSAGAYEEGAVAPAPGGSGGGIFSFPLLPLGKKILF